MKLYVSIPALVAAGLLSACADSIIPISQVDGGIAFLESLDGEQSPVTADDLPDNATMNGYLAASENYSTMGEVITVYLGDATADFNFENNTLSGSATNFNEYEVSEGEEELTTEQGRALDGSMAIIGGIDDTSFYYSANGQLTSEVEDLGTVTANVFLNGSGGIFSLDDKLTATGTGSGSVELTSSETGSLGGFDLDSAIGLQE
jgi:hypothetical protein